MARLRKSPRYQRHKKDRMSTTQIDVIRSLVKGSVVKDYLVQGSHARRAIHAAATRTTPATTTGVEPTVNQISHLAEQERDGILSGANGRGKETLGTTGDSERDMTVESTHPSLAEQERDGVLSGANSRGKETLGTTGDSERDMTVESTHPSTEEQSETSKNGASGTAEQIAIQQDWANVSNMMSDMLGCMIHDYPLVAGLKTLFEFVHAWYTGAFGSSSVFPASVPAELWFRIIVRFGIGFVLIKYRGMLERYMNHIRIALVALCLCGLVRDVGSGNVSWKTIFTTGIAVPLLMYQAVVQKEAGGMVVMLR